MESETTTLRSHITAYRIENGRRYHAYKDGAYWGPNDDLQNEQLDIAHHLYTLMLNGALHLAPIGKHPQRVLDLGTGTGIWAIDFADQYPSAIVVGTDLSPTQPSWVPPNVKFEIEDFTEDWTFRPNDFDFIHLRSLYGSVPDWPRFYKKVYRHLKPGAWMEQLEISVGFHSDDGSVVPDSALARFGPLFREASIRFGKPLDIASKMKSQIDDIGFVNTVEKVWKVPIRGWAAEPRMKELGHWGLLELDVGLEGFAMALLTRVLGVSNHTTTTYHLS
jgi:SAM-dependent methyltransferase